MAIPVGVLFFLPAIDVTVVGHPLVSMLQILSLAADMPDKMPDKMPEDMPDRMPDRMPEDMPGRMPEDMPDRMPDRMLEDMSDRSQKICQQQNV